MRCNYNNNILFYIIIMTCSTSHPRITSFYEANPHISFEAMNLLIIDIMEKMVLSNQENHPIISNKFQQLLQNTNDNMSNVTTMVPHYNNYIHPNYKKRKAFKTHLIMQPTMWSTYMLFSQKCSQLPTSKKQCLNQITRHCI